MRTAACCLSAIAFVWPASSLAAADQRPHVVLVMADDQGWGDMAYNGHPQLQTPHFDAAARENLRFDRFYAAAPVCSPTRASVMTGRHPNRMGVFKWGYPMRPQEITIAEALQAAGYRTAHFGKWHLGSVRDDSPASPGRNGFDHWLSAPNFFDNSPILSRQGRAVALQGESSIVTVDAAIDWLRSESAAEPLRPLLAVVWFGSPHGPHRAAEEDAAHYADLPANLRNFYGEVTGMDRAFGKLRGAIDELGLKENTILWYCSDNGALPKVGSSGGRRANKGSVYEGGLLVPAILQWPAGMGQPRVVSQRCNTCDIYPTILELTGVKVDRQPPLDGVSLAPLIRGGQPIAEPRTMGFWDYPIRGISTPSAKWMGELLKAQQAGGDLTADPASQAAAELPDPPFATNRFPGHSAWIEGDWKLHRIDANRQTARKRGGAAAAKPAAVRWELYDLAADPNEARDLFSEQPQRSTRMRQSLQDWLGSVARSLNGEDYADQSQ